MNKENPFTERCTCMWSKDNEYGFIPNARCPAHGKSVRALLKDSVEIKMDKNNSNE